MLVRIAVLAAASMAALTLSACDQETRRGEIGDCYRVVGVDSLGNPDLEPAACAAGEASAAVAGEAATETAEAVPGGESVAATPAAAACVEPSALAACCAQLACAQPAAAAEAKASTRSYVQTSAVRPKVAAGQAATRRRAAASSSTVTRRTEPAQTGLGIEYARVGEGAYQDYSQNYQGGYGQAYAAPVGRSASGHSVNVQTQSSESSRYSEQAYAQSSYGAGYSQQGGYGYQQGYGYQDGGYGHGAGGQCCAPQSPAPRGPFDQNGYLTWPGKVGR